MIKNSEKIKEKLVCSIVVPMYNAENFISQTLDSILSQTEKNFEVICVDDCSKDRTIEIVKEYQKKDSRIKLIQNESNLKVSRTRNRGIEIAQADWIALLDSDDMWETTFLEEVIKKRNETNARLVSTSCKFMTNEGEILSNEFIVNDVIKYKELLKQNSILCSSVFIEKNLLIKYPFFADSVHEDYVCWLSILKEIGCSYAVTKPLMIYRLTTGSKSRNKLKAIKMTYFTYRKHGLNPISSLFYTFCNAINGIKKYSKINKGKIVKGK